ncbi:hypothetical protein HPB49_005183 [Dermacentor silvarum]|uniref:Uncharacterized protein n=1 Tax=Dermacentor silvarum TaxID=543639 RepID=A0ACB8DVL1_DERSI|nr:hypothetical protein HPB49_005183 [Dermacentor silvarum]
MGHKDFKCSNGWLERFKKRHSVNRDTVDVWCQHWLQALLEKYEDKDTNNLHEAALFYKMLPNHTFTTTGGSSSRGKQSKERVMVLFGANATGEKKLPFKGSFSREGGEAAVLPKCNHSEYMHLQK